MDANQLQPDSPLPNDVPTLHAIIRQLLGEIEQLKTRLDQALKHRFGKRSERQKAPPQQEPRPPRKNTPHGRAPLPEHLPRREVIHDLTELEKCCPCCGEMRTCIGEQRAEQLDVEPARYFVLRTIRRSYACKRCDPDRVPVEQRFTTAGPPEVGPLARGLCGPVLLASVLTAKYVDHQPLHRQVGQIARSGVKVSASTLGDWMAGAANLLTPLVLLMQQRLLLSRVIHSDDTGVKLRVRGRNQTTRSHLWAYLGDADYPYVVFDFTADYTATGPERFLAGYSGYLQADALAQYEGLFGPQRVVHVCCWAHARRKFVTALESGEQRARPVLDWIGQLYATEREMPALLLPGEGPEHENLRHQREATRYQIRQERSLPVLAQLKQWLQEHKSQVLPKTALGVALGYALNNWEALSRYTDSGILCIDNNLSERTLRTIALGRNNWGVLGSEAGGRTAATLYSVVGTCKRLGVDPQRYLQEALPGLFALGEKPSAESLSSWLPDRWLLSQRICGPGALPVSAG